MNKPASALVAVAPPPIEVGQAVLPRWLWAVYVLFALWALTYLLLYL